MRNGRGTEEDGACRWKRQEEESGARARGRMRRNTREVEGREGENSKSGVYENLISIF